MRVILLIKVAKIKEDYLSGDSDEEVDESGLSRAKRIQLGIENEEDLEFSSENKFIKMFSKENLEFSYKPYSFNLKEVHDFFPIDEDHTMIMTEFGGNLPAKIGWQEWLKAWETHTGEAIYLIGEAAKNQKQK